MLYFEVRYKHELQDILYDVSDIEPSPIARQNAQ